MECPRCGAEGFTGVCSYCGFPVTRANKNIVTRSGVRDLHNKNNKNVIIILHI